MDRVPMEIKRLILQYFDHDERSFMSLSLTCRSWAEACQLFRFPVGHLVFGPGPMFEGPRLKPAPNTQVISMFSADFQIQRKFKFSQRTAYTIEESRQMPPSISESKIHMFEQRTLFAFLAMSRVIELTEQYRIQQLSIDMDLFDSDITELFQNVKGLRCHRLHVRNAQLHQITAITDAIKANNYHLETKHNAFCTTQYTRLSENNWRIGISNSWRLLSIDSLYLKRKDIDDLVGSYESHVQAPMCPCDICDQSWTLELGKNPFVDRQARIEIVHKGLYRLEPFYNVRFSIYS